MRAIAIVRQDFSGQGVQAEVDSVRALARRMKLDLSARDTHVVTDLVVLLAHLNSTRTDVVLVPSERHLRGWMDTVRRTVEVWTVDPPLCWPRGGGRPHSIIRPDRHLQDAVHQRMRSGTRGERRVR
ncbi:hypothetical protein [Nocardia salmonicida]|uniref:hypothetical protein n=1 Tax=Nocardia salmonicida TaxID=53431 RepID=UPI0007A55C1A|nr:hypothetical protein [Nocardia salmonicida]MBC7299550.1 hypothetical protein [Nocardia sp.]